MRVFLTVTAVLCLLLPVAACQQGGEEAAEGEEDPGIAVPEFISTTGDSVCGGEVDVKRNDTSAPQIGEYIIDAVTGGCPTASIRVNGAQKNLVPGNRTPSGPHLVEVPPGAIVQLHCGGTDTNLRCDIEWRFRWR